MTQDTVCGTYADIQGAKAWDLLIFDSAGYVFCRRLSGLASVFECTPCPNQRGFYRKSSSGWPVGIQCGFVRPAHPSAEVFKQAIDKLAEATRQLEEMLKYIPGGQDAGT